MAFNTYEGTTSQTSSSMLNGARANEPEAWRRIVDRYSRRIYRWCRRAGLQPEDASDVVQEVFRSVARKLVDFHHDQQGDTFRGWLYRITQNKLRDYFGRAPGRKETARGGTDAQRQFMQLADDCFATDATGERPSADGRRHGDILQRVRAEFSERDWRVFWRVVVDGQTSTEAGEQFQMSSNAVRLVKMRIMRRVRELIDTTGAS